MERSEGAVSKSVVSLTGDRGFESTSLQGRVSCELDFGKRRSARSGAHHFLDLSIIQRSQVTKSTILSTPPPVFRLVKTKERSPRIGGSRNPRRLARKKMDANGGYEEMKVFTGPDASSRLTDMPSPASVRRL
jgi:hypothetical protein